MSDDADVTCEFSLTALQSIIGILRSATGCNFSLYKTSTFIRRLQARKDNFPHLDADAYVDYLFDNPAEKEALFQTILIGVTSFFRDPAAYEALFRELERLLEQKKSDSDSFRAWVPACSTGEEVYSLVILTHEAAQTTGYKGNISFFASDLDVRSIETARRGWYSANSVNGLSPQRLEAWFDAENGGWRIKKALRENVIFAPQNLLSDPPYPRIDLLSCRNLMIYLNSEVQKTLTALFAYSLASSGILFLGSSESIEARSPWFVAADKKAKIFQRKPGPRPPVAIFNGVTHLPERKVTMPNLDKAPREQIIQDLVLELVAGKHYPTTVLVDSQGEIQFILGDTTEIFHRRNGRPSNQVVDNAIEALRIPLANALAMASSAHQTVTTDKIRLAPNSPKIVQAIIYPVENSLLGGPHFLSVFQTLHAPLERLKRRGPAQTPHDAKIAELERELQETRVYLRNTVQKLEHANALLTASNEETQSINEELQSANEELESSKEELQATNEELGNLNLAYSNRIDELSRVNNDIFNFVHSARIGIVFLDRSLRILRFTAETTSVIPVIEKDLGRSITAFSEALAEPEIELRVQSVLLNLAPVEREFSTQDGRVFLHRILPYRTLEDRIDGVVMTFTDISDLKKAEKNLREGEEKYRLLFENLPVPVLAGELLRDGQGKCADFLVLGINPAFETMMGVRQKDALGNRGSLVLPSLETWWTEVQERVVRTGQPESSKVYSASLKRHLHVWIYPSGQDRFALFFEDITEQTEALEALRLSEDLYRSTLRSIDDWVTVLDKEGRVVELFPSANHENQFDQILNLSPEARTQQNEALAKLAEGESVCSWTFSVPAKQKTFSSRMSRRLDAKGNFHGAVMVTRDISDLIQAQQAVRESESQFRALFEAAPLGFFQLESGRVRRANAAFAEIFGFSTLDSLENLSWDDLFSPDSLEAARRLFQALQAGNYESSWADLMGRKKDGSYFPVRFDLAQAPRQGSSCTIGVAQDLTERRRMEQSLLNSQRLESLGVLAGGIAHDFNNLLGGIFGFLELAQLSSEPNSKAAHYIERSISAFHRAQELTRQLITFSRGGQPVKCVAELPKLLEENSQFVLSGGNVRLQTHFSPSLWSCEMDISQMGQVVDNLVINARQAMPQGGTITITAENIPEDLPKPVHLTPGPYVRISFSDNGPGIPKDILSKIFDPFFSTKKEGSGLGLATVYSILTKHGGAVEVESELNKGTTFHLWLPALPDSKQKEPLNAPAEQSRPRVLVLDDEESLREVTEAFLKDMGYEVVCVSRGEEATQIFVEAEKSRRPFGFALVDLTIPGEKGGLEVVKDLRTHNPVLVAAAMTGYSNDHVLADPASYGLVGCLSKPFTRQELQGFLETHYPLKLV
jgi:two-component system CheB/CheR fusion protein